MKGTKARTVNTLGMFDLFKGIGMATVIFVHTAESYSIDLGGGLSVTSFLLFIYREALMSAFYIASGYGFRKRSVGKCVQQQLRGILPPFLYTALATAGLHLFLHHHFFGSWEVAVAESEKVLAGFLLGLPHTSDYFGMNIFSCGPMWYLLTMRLDHPGHPVQRLSRAVHTLRGGRHGHPGLGHLPCVGAALLPVPGHDGGALPLSGPHHEKAPLAGAAPAALAVPGGGGLHGGVGGGVHPVRRHRQYVHGRVDPGPRGHLRQGVGRRSLNIFCLHTVELIAVPWYLFAAQFAANPIVGLLAQYLLRCTLIAAGCLLLELRKRVASPRTRKARLARRQERVQRYVARH